jgi:glycosyltransferase involved in cell wall biosynthesis
LIDWSEVTGNYAFLTPYPPQPSGLATFGAALRRHLVALVPGSSGDVVRVVDETGSPAADEVVHDLVTGSSHSRETCVDVLNGYDVVLVQHDYDSYGDRDGEELVDLLHALDVPVVVVLHTVLAQPSRRQRLILARLAARADAVVTMSDAAAQRLLDGYTVDPEKLSVIPPGAPADGLATASLVPTRPTILTWGRLGPTKGIGSAFAALSGLRDLAPRYVVAGQTHPEVPSRSYHSALRAEAKACGVADLVEFIPTHLDPHTLGRLIRQASVVLLPYESNEQVTSGVLVEAIAAQRPVVATRFPHAVELLSGGCGLLVPRNDPSATSRALRRVLTEPGLAVAMADKASVLAAEFRWPVVAERYRALVGSLVTAGTEPAR